MRTVCRTEVRGERFEKEVFDGKDFSSHKFEECDFFGCRFTSCTFDDCDFRRVMFSQETQFVRCRFTSCRFSDQHTYLGGPSLFLDCSFLDCSFKNVQLWEARFVRCVFTGVWESIVVYGPEAPDGWECGMEDVDLTGLKMNLVDFRCGFDESSVRR